MDDKVEKSDEEWRRELTPEQYRVLRRFLCAGCGAELFRADDKFESGTGWPSFSRPAEARAVASERDSSHGMERVEVHCRRCGGHLGHVFQDGPAPTGERYCINSASLKKGH